MAKVIEMSGRRFGEWTVINRDDNLGHPIRWICRCSCGTVRSVQGNNLRSGKSTGCGCVANAATAARNYRHGMSDTETFRIWAGMKKRCENPNDKNYSEYGGRGIRVCDDWQDFQQFHADMGDRPHGMSIDRIDHERDYEPDNCRWADACTQSNNRRNNVVVRIGRETKTFTEWCRHYGIKYHTAKNRHRRGMSAEEAILSMCRDYGRYVRAM